jgi:ubiquinone/menaquinone biosynthesis C-methylase UbiE
LDVVCGQGIIACELAKFVSDVTGIDITPALIEQAKQMQKESKLNNVTWKIDNILSLPYYNSSCSLVVTRYSFHHVLYPEKVLDEMIRVCKSGGNFNN